VSREEGLKLVSSNPKPTGGAGTKQGPVEVIDAPDPVIEARARCWDALKQPERAATLRKRMEIDQ
jgi:hypothetical protein